MPYSCAEEAASRHLARCPAGAGPVITLHSLLLLSRCLLPVRILLIAGVALTGGNGMRNRCQW